MLVFVKLIPEVEPVAVTADIAHGTLRTALQHAAGGMDDIPAQIEAAEALGLIPGGPSAVLRLVQRGDKILQTAQGSSRADGGYGGGFSIGKQQNSLGS